MRQFSSHGSGRFVPEALGTLGRGVILEEGVLIFRPEFVHLAQNVYVGHRAQLKAYPEGGLFVGRDTWIGPNCFLSAAARLTIGEGVGIGPSVHILTSTHEDPGWERPIMDGALRRAEVIIGDGADLGVGAIVLPGVTVGKGVQLGAGAVVHEDIPDYAVAVGVPARVVGSRKP